MPNATARHPEYPLHCTLKYFKDTIPPCFEGWLGKQPEQIELNACCIMLGPHGAAMMIDMNDYINKKYSITATVCQL